MPVLKNPCVICKEKHLRCSDDTPQCSRCRSKGLECIRPGRRKPFRQGSAANFDYRFPDSQTWLRSNAREFRLYTSSQGRAQRIPTEADPNLEDDALEVPTGMQGASPGAPLDAPTSLSPISQAHENPPNEWVSMSTQMTTPSHQSDAFQSPISSLNAPDSNEDHGGVFRPSYNHIGLEHIPSPHKDRPQVHQEKHDLAEARQIREACLLAYYVDELSHWFDIADPLRSFEILVPERAKHYPPLLNAIYAVSARHICRLRQYRTPDGHIMYRDQLLHDIHPGTAVEYMLKALPALRGFHTTYDEDTRGLMVATAIILRQFEEMEDDHDDDEEEAKRADPDSPNTPPQRVNFLSIISTVLKSSNTEEWSNHSSLLKASYWIALRQEIYYGLLKGHPPDFVQTPQIYANASPTNRLIIHASHVTAWHFDGRSEQEWLILKQQEETLEETVVKQFEPILSLPPKKEDGHVFPIIWYHSAIGLTAMQHFLLAKMILLAESPLLVQSSDARSAFREAELRVRSIALDICGIAIQHPKTPLLW
ncbi:hypothetical protein V2G26_014949 [Clonostachys chloroleuca]